jgi:hypothetical protein
VAGVLGAVPGRRRIDTHSAHRVAHRGPWIGGAMIVSRFARRWNCWRHDRLSSAHPGECRSEHPSHPMLGMIFAIPSISDRGRQRTISPQAIVEEAPEPT